MVVNFVKVIFPSSYRNSSSFRVSSYEHGGGVSNGTKGPYASSAIEGNDRSIQCTLYQAIYIQTRSLVDNAVPNHKKLRPKSISG